MKRFQFRLSTFLLAVVIVAQQAAIVHLWLNVRILSAAHEEARQAPLVYGQKRSLIPEPQATP